MMVKAPGELIEEAIKHCPPAYTLAARDPEQDLPLDGNHVYLGTDGCGVQIIDLYSSELRTSKLEDVADIARIADAIEEIAFHWVPVSAQDKPAESRGLSELKAVWENSTKHVQTESVYNEAEAYAAVEMAKMIAGDSEALRNRPPLSIMQCTASPLGQDGGSLDAALIVAYRCACPMSGSRIARCLPTSRFSGGSDGRTAKSSRSSSAKIRFGDAS
jgi:trimethylamine--corrinoid protein Co-methyltransferase